MAFDQERRVDLAAKASATLHGVTEIVRMEMKMLMLLETGASHVPTLQVFDLVKEQAAHSTELSKAAISLLTAIVESADDLRGVESEIETLKTQNEELTKALGRRDAARQNIGFRPPNGL